MLPLSPVPVSISATTLPPPPALGQQQPHPRPAGAVRPVSDMAASLPVTRCY